MTPITSRLKKTKPLQKKLDSSTAGFTVVEVLVVVIMVGILSVLSGAGLLGWLNRLRVNAARDVVSSAIYDAQSRAQQRNDFWRASFREKDGSVQWAVHPKTVNDPTWTTIEQSSIVIDDANTDFTKNSNIWTIQFDNKGRVDGTNTGRLTISSSSGANKRCVRVKTLLGSINNELDTACTKK